MVVYVYNTIVRITNPKYIAERTTAGYPLVYSYRNDTDTIIVKCLCIIVVPETIIL